MTSPIRTSEAIADIALALAAAQAEFTPVEKKRQGKIEGESKNSGKGYSFTYAYADISDVLAMALPILAKHKIATMQPTVMDGNVLTIVTRLIHGGTGQWIESDYPVCSLTGDHKKMGGSLTYSRRYALTSLLGIAPDDDVDGEGSEDPAPKDKAKPKTRDARGPESRPAADDGYDGAFTPFDDFPPSDGAPKKEKIPAVSSNAIAMGREIAGCTSMLDLNRMKGTKDFVDWWAAANGEDRAHITAVANRRKAELEAAMDRNILAGG